MTEATVPTRFHEEARQSWQKAYKRQFERAEAAEARVAELERQLEAARSTIIGNDVLFGTVKGERDTVLARVAELEGIIEFRDAELDEAQKTIVEEEEQRELVVTRLLQATTLIASQAEALRECRDQAKFGRHLEKQGEPAAGQCLLKVEDVAESALVALAGEDEKPAEPQREGDYL